MRKLLLSKSHLIVLALFVVSCSASEEQNNTESAPDLEEEQVNEIQGDNENDSLVDTSSVELDEVVELDTTEVVEGNDLENQKKVVEPVKAIDHGAPNQAVIDSIKAAKTKGKKK